MKKPITVWAIQHVGHEDLGSFEFTLKAAGIKPTYICSRDVDLTTLDAAEPDLLVILGGPIGVYEADRYPFITKEITFARTRIDSGKPLLGICLGSQIIAAALGARVYKGAAGQEIGWRPITLTEAGERSPLRHLGADDTSMMHWHGDTFDLPSGAVRLAASDRYINQAYSYQDHVLGVQCHPEVTEAKLERWYKASVADIAEVDGLTVDDLRADAARYGAQLRVQAHAFLTEWLGIVAPHIMEGHTHLNLEPAE